MSEIQKENTYTNDEYFKIIVLSQNEEQAIANARWLTNNNKRLIRDDLLRCQYKQTSLICYPRFIGDIKNGDTKAFEAIAVFADEQEEFNTLSNILNDHYDSYNCKLLISNNVEAENWARQLNIKHISKQDRESVISALDELDKEEFNYIKGKFEEYDDDKSGFISTEEMPNMVKSLGCTPNEEELKAAILSFDTNKDGKISIEEFLIWWKLGRRDPFAFAKFYELENYSKNKLSEIFNQTKLQRAYENEELSNSTKNTSVDIDIDTKNIEEYTTRINIRLGVAGEARANYCKNYLSRYNDKIEFNQDCFIDFAVFIQSCTIEGMSAKDYVESFKNEIIDKIDRTYIPGFKNFIGNFIVVKIFAQEYSVNVRFEFKYDIQELLKNALSDYLDLTNWLTNNGKQPLNLDFIMFSGKTLNELIDENTSFKELLDKCEIKIKFQAVKDKIRQILGNINGDYADYIKLLQPLIISSNLKLKYEGVANEFTDKHSTSMLEKKTVLIKDLVEFFKNHIPNDLRKIMSRLEIGANIVNTFASIQLFSENNWADSN